MISVIYDFENRIKQIEQYLIFVWIIDTKPNIPNLTENKLVFDHKEILLSDYIDSSGLYSIDSELIKILKSNTILLLYNLIEGTINVLLNEYFGVLNRENKEYNKYKLPIKKIWLKYKHRSFSSGDMKKDEYIIRTIETLLSEIIEIKPKTIKDSELGERILHNYDAYISETNSNEISGNLDARKIRELFVLYGLPNIDKKCDSMVKVKNKRNNLAHGNETFAQVGSNFTIKELFQMKDEIVDFLNYLIIETETYITNQGFLHTD